MKLCFFISNISNCGGTERACTLIANELCKHGFEIIILSCWGKAPYFKCDSRIKICQLNYPIMKGVISTHPQILVLKARWWYYRHRPDIVIDVALMSSNITLPAIDGLGIKHIVWYNFSYEFLTRISHEQIALEKIKKNGSYIVTLTSTDMDLFIKEKCVLPNLIQHIPNPLTFQVKSPITHQDKMVLSVGRFSHEKGFDMLLRAWEIVEKSIPDWHLEIWGDTGTDNGDVYATYNSLCLKNASLHPSTKNIQLLYKKASIYVLPSRHEGFGLVLLEASAFSLPLIAFDCPNGPREIVNNGYNGLLVTPNDIESLASAIIRLICHKNEREQMGRNAYILSKKYSIDPIIHKWINLFETI